MTNWIGDVSTWKRPEEELKPPEIPDHELRLPGTEPKNGIHILYRFYDTNKSLLYVSKLPNLQQLRYQEWFRDVEYIRLQRFADAEQLSDAKIVAIERELPKHNRRKIG